MRRLIALFLAFCALVYIYGCAVSPSQPFVLKKVSYSDLPAWKNDDMRSIFPVLQKNCDALGVREEWKSFCAGIAHLNGSSSAEIRRFIEKPSMQKLVAPLFCTEGRLIMYAPLRDPASRSAAR